MDRDRFLLTPGPLMTTPVPRNGQVRMFDQRLKAEHRAPIIVTLHTPDHSACDFQRFHAAAKARGFMRYPGKLTPVETFRVGCIAAIGAPTMQQAVNAVAEVLHEMGIPATAA